MDKLQPLARLLDRVAGGRASKLACWSGLLVFNHHRIGEASESPYDRGVYSTTAEGLSEQVAFLTRHFDVVGLDDLEGLPSKPGRHVLITFDDGYRDNYDVAFPILRAHGAKAAIFVSAGFLDRGGVAWWDEIAWMVRRSTGSQLQAGEWLDSDLPTIPSAHETTIRSLHCIYKALPAGRREELLDWLALATGSGHCTGAQADDLWMTWDMVREMNAEGMDIGGHTVSHSVLSGLAPEVQASEISGVADRMRAELGEPMRWFAYPAGGRDAFNDTTRSALAKANVEFAFSYYGGYQRPGDWDKYDLRRVSAALSGPRFRATTLLPWLFASGGGWVSRARAAMGRR